MNKYNGKHIVQIFHVSLTQMGENVVDTKHNYEFKNTQTQYNNAYRKPSLAKPGKYTSFGRLYPSNGWFKVSRAKLWTVQLSYRSSKSPCIILHTLPHFRWDAKAIFDFEQEGLILEYLECSCCADSQAGISNIQDNSAPIAFINLMLYT